jgi:hypothetical protein
VFPLVGSLAVGGACILGVAAVNGGDLAQLFPASHLGAFLPLAFLCSL